MASSGKYYYAYDQPESEPWFVDGEGIERRVIQTDLPRYLGNGTTLRAGMGPDVRWRPVSAEDVCLLSADGSRRGG